MGHRQGETPKPTRLRSRTATHQIKIAPQGELSVRTGRRLGNTRRADGAAEARNKRAAAEKRQRKFERCRISMFKIGAMSANEAHGVKKNENWRERTIIRFCRGCQRRTYGETRRPKNKQNRRTGQAGKLYGVHPRKPNHELDEMHP